MRHRPPSLYPVPRLAEGAVLLLEELFVVEAGDIVGRGAQLFEDVLVVGADNEDILEELGATPDDVASLYDEQLLKKENGPFG